MNIDDAMIEKVARALCEADGRDPETPSSWDGELYMESGPLWKSRIKDARRQIAAFAAIREHLRMTGRQF